MLSIVIDKENKQGDIVVIKDPADIKHIVSVFRLNVGDELRLVDGENEYIGSIAKVSKKEVLVEITSTSSDKYSLGINIDIAIGIIKNDKMKLMIQKLTEIGVRNIIPLKTERVVVKINDKKEKWDDIVREAMKQCRAVKKTNVLDILKLRDLDTSSYDKVIYLFENSNESVKISEVIDKKDKNVLCIIGPEGGLTQEEVNYMNKKGFYEVSLGNRILRAETAAIVVSSVISHIYGY